MFGYYFALALRSLKRSKVLTVLMILAIGLGIGASMTMITVLHVMSGDPLPGRSMQLFVPQLDARPLERSKTSKDSAPNGNLTWPDAMNLLRAHRADRQAAMVAGSAPIRPTQGSLRPFFQPGHYVTADFFPMFGTPFRTGSGWTAQDDEQRARVVVLNAELNRRLFGDTLGIGRTVRLKNTDFRVIGVLDDWYPQPTFYAQVNDRSFGKTDQFFPATADGAGPEIRFQRQFHVLGQWRRRPYQRPLHLVAVLGAAGQSSQGAELSSVSRRLLARAADAWPLSATRGCPALRLDGLAHPTAGDPLRPASAVVAGTGLPRCLHGQYRRPAAG
jgi:ABC-type transport system, involved in lipoprotein release, permease component